MDRLDELAALVAILDEGSLAAAGRKLRRSPPAMTRALSALEERVGARLVERTTRRLTATAEGKRLAEQARRTLAGYDETVRATSGPLRGELRITAPLVFGRRHVTPIVASFLDAHPGITVDLVLDDRGLDMVAEGLEVAVRIGRLTDSGLVARRVGEVRRVVVASPAYVARRGRPRDPTELAEHDIVFSANRRASLSWRFRGGRTVKLAPRLLVNEVDAMLIAVRGGRGIGQPLSYQVADDLAAHSLVRLLADWEPPPLPVQLVVPSNRHLAAKARAFVEHAAAALAALEVIR